MSRFSTWSCNCSMWMKSGPLLLHAELDLGLDLLADRFVPAAAQAASTAFSILKPIQLTTRGLPDLACGRSRRMTRGKFGNGGDAEVRVEFEGIAHGMSFLSVILSEAEGSVQAAQAV